MFHRSGQQEKQDKAPSGGRKHPPMLPPKLPPPVFQPAEYIVDSIQWFGRGRCLSQEKSTAFTAPVAGLLPGETARVAIEDGMLRNARIVDVLTRSPDRVAPSCSQAAICPGCTMQHVGREGRAHYAATLVAEVLEKYAGFAWNVADVDVVMGPDGDHRTRTRLMLRQGAPAEVGMRRSRTSTEPLVDFRVCRANAPELRAVAEVLAEEAWPEPVVASAEDGLVSVEVEVLRDADGRSTLLVSEDATAVASWAHAVLDDARARLGVDAVRLAGDDRPWTHANPAMSERLYAYILERLLVDARRVFDLTCGDGGCTFAMAACGATVFASDRHWEAVQRTAASAAARGIAEVHCRGGDALAVLKGAAKRGEVADIIVINPMREPVGDDTMHAVDASDATELLYMAPAPKAGAKDLRVLREAGWRLDHVAAVDLHPWTGQVMMVAIARRARP